MRAPRQLRIALVGPTHPFRGGIAQYTALLCRALRRHHEVRFYALRRQYPRLLFPGRSQTDETSRAFRVEHDPCVGPLSPPSWFRTARKISGWSADLIVFAWWNPFFAPAFGTIARLARRATATPSCFLCHNVLPHERSRLDRLLLRYAFGAGAAFITHSQQDRDDLAALRPGAPIHVGAHPTYEIFGGPDAGGRDRIRAQLDLAGRRVLLFFGFVREYKGLHVLLDAVERLPPEDGYHLLVVGEFYDDPARYRAALDRLRERGQLTLVDRYVADDEVGRYFAAADLVMVPYVSATQSGVIQIAYAFRKPVVATTVGGIPDAVAEGETGYLVPPGDAAALAAAVRRYFGEADRSRFERRIAAESERYSWDRMVERIEHIGWTLAAPAGTARRNSRNR